jgi:hypothetical protein
MLEVGAAIGIGTRPGDPGGVDELVDKVELDWGDGSGYQDLTSDAIDKWWHGGEGTFPNDPNFLSLHTYDTPGEFTMTARVTFWDGEVKVDKPEDRIHITITSP